MCREMDVGVFYRFFFFTMRCYNIYVLHAYDTQRVCVCVFVFVLFNIINFHMYTDYYSI
jgi:hypothetical protein